MPKRGPATGETFSAYRHPIAVSQPEPSKPEKGQPRDASAPGEEPEDEVDEAGEESFPASDAPSWTSAIASAVNLSL